MNGIARVMNAIRRQPGGGVAKGELTIDRAFAGALLGRPALGEPEGYPFSDADLLIACCRALGLDMVCLQSGAAAASGSAQAAPSDEMKRFRAAGLFVFWIVDGAFQTAMARQGMETLMTDIAAAPDRVGAMLRRLSEEVTAHMARGVAAGAHGVIIADDIAYQQATYTSPDFIRTYLLPVWRDQARAAGDLGAPVFLHSDGNLNSVLPHIAAAGFDGLQCIEPAAGMDIRAIKAEYGKDLCLMGGIDPALLAPPMDPAGAEKQRRRLAQAVQELMEMARAEGGMIFGTCSGLHAGMAPELVRRMYALAAS